MPDKCIFFIQFVKLAFLEEQDSVPVLLLDLPKLFFKRCERLPCTGWDIQCAFVVIHVARPVHVLIADVQEEVIGLFIFESLAFFLLHALLCFSEV